MPRSRSARHKSLRTAPPLPVRLTHPDREIFSEPRITKRDLAVYYAHVAERMLPHISGRPLSVFRCPEGTAKTCFFQKHPPAGLPTTVRRARIREKDQVGIYLVVDTLEGLLALVQHGVIEVHTWGVRDDDVEKPDRLVFDLDPDPAVVWKQVVDAAVRLRKLLADVGLTAFVKTTGGKGLHVVVPIHRRHLWQEVKLFCRGIAHRLADSDPRHYTVNPLKIQRQGRIFIDYLRNERGATAVAPFSVRARPNAPVATPLAWEALPKLKGPQQFTIAKVHSHLARQKSDPWANLLTLRQSLPRRTNIYAGRD